MSWNDLFQLYRQRFLSWRHSCAQIQRKVMQNTIDISRILSHSEFGFPKILFRFQVESRIFLCTVSPSVPSKVQRSIISYKIVCRVSVSVPRVFSCFMCDCQSFCPFLSSKTTISSACGTLPFLGPIKHLAVVLQENTALWLFFNNNYLLH